jgi:hypothetical protein
MRSLHGGEMKPNSIKTMQYLVNTKLDKLCQLADLMDKPRKYESQSTKDTFSTFYEAPLGDLLLLLSVLSVEAPRAFKKDYQILFDEFLENVDFTKEK